MSRTRQEALVARILTGHVTWPRSRSCSQTGNHGHDLLPSNMVAYMACKRLAATLCDNIRVIGVYEESGCPGEQPDRGTLLGFTRARRTAAPGTTGNPLLRFCAAGLRASRRDVLRLPECAQAARVWHDPRPQDTEKHQTGALPELPSP